MPELVERQVRLLPASVLEQNGLSADMLIERVVAVGRRNLVSGRIRHVMVQSKLYPSFSDGVYERYVARLVPCYCEEHQRIAGLERGEEEVWLQTRAWLLRRAAQMLRHWDTSDASAPAAEDFVQEVCATLHDTLGQYAFDAAFDAWLTRILHSTIAARFMRSRDILDRRSDVGSLNQQARYDPSQAVRFVRWLADPKQISRFEQAEIRMILEDALRQLPAVQQTILLHTYVYDLPDAQISSLVGTSVGNVAQLRFRALRKLRRSIMRTG
jgi:RNA polymerase sigma factor (sigma-70 family)